MTRRAGNFYDEVTLAPREGAKLYVYLYDNHGNKTSNLASLTDDNGAPIANPITLGASGDYVLNTANDTYYAEVWEASRLLLIIEAFLVGPPPVGAGEAADAAIAAAASAEADAAQTAADRIATEAAAALSETSADRAETAALIEGAYPNAYAGTTSTNLPKGVTSIAITAAGTGYANGTYALGVAGGPANFAGTYTVTGGTVTSTTITNPGLSTNPTAPTLSFPSGGGTGATATATVSGLVAPGKTYWAADSGSRALLLYRNNSGTPVAENMPNGLQIAMPLRPMTDEALLAHSPLQSSAILVSKPELRRIKRVHFYNAVPEVAVQWCVRDSAGARLILRLAEVATPANVYYAHVFGANPNPSTDPLLQGGVGRVTMNLIGPTAGVIAGEIDYDFDDGATHGAATAFTLSQTKLSQSAIRLTDGERAEFEDIVTSLSSDGPPPYLPTVADTYLLDIVEDISIEGGVPGRNYVTNFRTDNSSGTRRLRIEIYDPIRGAVVAAYAQSKAYDWQSEFPECFCVAGSALGSIRGDVQYVGLTATIWLRKDRIAWAYPLSTYTTAAQAGIKTDRVLSPERVRQMVLEGKGVRNRVITYGPTLGDFATLSAALDSLQMDGNVPATTARNAFPFSNVATPSNQIHVIPVEAVDEQFAERAPGGVGTGRIIWPGVNVYLRGDTRIWTNPTTTSAPVFDVNFGGRVIALPGAKLENLSLEGYVYHCDPTNGIFGRSVANVADKAAGLQHFNLTFLHDGGKLEGQNRCIGRGDVNGQHVEFRNCILKLSGPTPGSQDLSHTTPNHVNGGDTIWNNVSFVGGAKSIGLIKSDNPVATNRITINGSDIALVALSVTGGGVGSSQAYVRNGLWDARITYPSALDPV